MRIEQKKRIIRYAMLAGLVALLIFLYVLRGVLWPFVFAFFIAYIFDPWIEFLARRMPRVVAILLVMIALALLLTLAAVIIIPQASKEIAEATAKFPQYWEVLEKRTMPWIQDLAARHPEIAAHAQEYFNTNVKQKLPTLLAPVLTFVSGMFSGVVAFLVTTLNLLLVPVLTFYLLKDFPAIRERFSAMIPPRHRHGIRGRFSEVNDALSQYLRGQLTVSIILGFIYTIGLLILGVPLAVPIGIFSGLANMVPYLGFILGIGASMLLSFVDNQDWHRLVWIVALYSFAQLMEGTWIGPLVMGKRTGLHPVVIMLALIIGGTLFGFMGMLLAVPFMAVATVFIKSAYDAYIQSNWYQEQKTTPTIAE